MHSSKVLSSTDFELRYRGREQSHEDFFADFATTDRLGVVVPNRWEGVGAIALIMAYVTAFYDRYRETGEEFFAYPDFFTFQRQHPVARYGGLDIWPDHKSVFVTESADDRAAAIADRGVNVLVVPQGGAAPEPSIEEVQLESLRRNVGRSFVYASDGRADEADLQVTCSNPELCRWAGKVFDSVTDDPEVEQRRVQWFEGVDKNYLRQSFREVELKEALGHV